MSTKQFPIEMPVDSPIGKMKVDSDGSPVACSRMDASKAYTGIPELLQKVINENDAGHGRLS